MINHVYEPLVNADVPESLADQVKTQEARANYVDARRSSEDHRDTKNLADKLLNVFHEPEPKLEKNWSADEILFHRKQALEMAIDFADQNHSKNILDIAEKFYRFLIRNGKGE